MTDSKPVSAKSAARQRRLYMAVGFGVGLLTEVVDEQ